MHAGRHRVTQGDMHMMRHKETCTQGDTGRHARSIIHAACTLRNVCRIYTETEIRGIVIGRDKDEEIEGHETKRGA